jgi:two-component system chemotaxis response regulator CheY
MRILVIDDSGIMRAMIIKFLSDSEFKNADFVEAKDGVDALDKFGTGGMFDVALVDWNMPRMNGIPCVEAMRKLDQRLTIVMVTTERGSDSVQQARKADVDGYVGKPFDAELITSKLKKALSDSEWRRA